MSDGLFSVRRYFEKRHLNVTDEWINSCFDWCKNSQGLRETSKIIKACFDQWLITDLRVEGVQRCQRLIQDPRALKSQVPAGFYPIQVSYAVDIGTSCQTQLQRELKIKNENAAVSAESESDRRMAAWEPKPSRMRKFCLSTGNVTIEAIEHLSLGTILPDPVPAGLKLILVGPITARRGILFLEPKHVKVLNGSVENMSEEFSTTKILKDRLAPPAHPSSSSALPTQVFQPKGLPIKYKDGCKARAVLQPRENRPFTSSSTPAAATANNNPSLFEDDDEDDELFATIELPTDPKRRRM